MRSAARHHNSTTNTHDSAHDITQYRLERRDIVGIISLSLPNPYPRQSHPAGRTPDMLADDLAGIRRIVTDVVALDDAPSAFERIRAGEVLKAVVTP